jgi:hypothetical protein
LKEIPLLRGGVTQVDDDVYDEQHKYIWRLNNGGYVVNVQFGHTFLLHHEVIGRPPKGMVTDHIDGNKQNNVRANLRHVSKQVNNQKLNTPTSSNSTFVGVHYYPDPNRPFIARISYNNKLIYLGSYTTAEEAAKAYDKKAIELFGEHARVNFSGTTPLENQEIQIKST